MSRSLVGVAMLIASSLAACELVAGVTGDRELRPDSNGGVGCAGLGVSCGGAGTGGTSAGGAMSMPSGTGGAFDDGGTAGVRESAGEAGFSDAGLSGAGGEGGAFPPPAPSCDGIDSCNDESPCITLGVPGGAFLMGRGDSGPDATIGGDSNEQPEHSVSVSPFWLDKYEVTVGRFRRFVESYDSIGKPAPGAGAHPAVSASGWQPEFDRFLPATRADLETELLDNDDTAENLCNANYRTWTPAAGNSECLPMNCIDWYLSFAFCIWDGGRLPSEAEWEFAAAGGPNNRLFPWGSAPPDGLSVFGCFASGSATCVPADLPPVGSTGAPGYGFYGHADLAGSVAERTRDIFYRNFYSENQAILPNVINLGFDSDTTAFGPSVDDSLARGGSFVSNGAALRAAARGSTKRLRLDETIGLRCARNR